MTSSVLLHFLSAGLINVQGDDAKFERLQETATDLAAALRKEPAKVIPFTLIATDPAAPEDDPVILEAIEALRKRWPTSVNTFAGTPVAVLRAVLLEALVQAASADEYAGVALVNLARNVLPFMEAGHESTIWTEVIGDVERQVDTRAEAEWATPEVIQAPPLELPSLAAIPVAVPKVSLDTEALATALTAAAGPQSMAGATNGNPYQPHANLQQWTTDYGNRAANAIGEAFDTALGEAEATAVDVAAPLKALTQSVAAYIESVVRAVGGAAAGLQRRTNLIWWKESLYSPAAGRSYRDLPAVETAALMAFDLHIQVPTFSPASVSAFLHETVRAVLVTDVSKTRALSDLLKDVATADALEPLRNAIGHLNVQTDGRSPVLGLLGKHTILASLDDAAFRAQTGVAPTTPLTIQAWALWLFRELQAARAVQQAAETKRKGRKS